MHYHQLVGSGERRVAVTDDSTTYDLTSANTDVRSFGDLARAASVSDASIDSIAARLATDAEPIDAERVDQLATVPVDASEVWAAGVTYQISEEAREAESSMPDIYLNVYDAERPEIFFKATPSRTVGPNEAIGVRADSEWNVPEPELGVVLRRGETIGYTIGNDVSSRSIEGQNPLYLPQAKVYARCCALGPCVVTAADVPDPHALDLSMRIHRDGETVYDDQTNTRMMARRCEELVSYLTQHNELPELAVLLTGTPLVPDESFDLTEGDRVEIEIEGIGTLTNPVVEV